ncbi:MAG TPA: VanZ family protein [Micromonosporaceae bacterium]
MSRVVARMSEAGIVLGTLPWLYLTMRGGPAGPDQMYWLPLSDLVRLAGGPPGFLMVQVVGNLLVFAAAGFLLPVRFAALASVPRVAAVAAAGSLVIELIQLLARHGRVFSVDDIWLNAVGAGLAAAASRRWWAGQPT